MQVKLNILQNEIKRQKRKDNRDYRSYQDKLAAKIKKKNENKSV